MDILHSHLESIEAPGLWNLNLCHESLGQVFENNTVRSSKECKNMLDEMFFIIIKLLPIFKILGEIDLFGSPEASHLIFVHFPNVIVLNWKNDESVWILIKHWLWKALSHVLGGRLLSGAITGRWYLKSTVLTGILFLNKLGAQYVHHGFTIGVSCNSSTILSELRLRLRELETNLFLAHMVLIVIRKNIGDFLLVVSHPNLLRFCNLIN